MVEHKFNKRNAQLLTYEIYCNILLLKAFCDKHYMDENMEPILMALKRLFSLADTLFVELDTWEVVNCDYK